MSEKSLNDHVKELGKRWNTPEVNELKGKLEQSQNLVSELRADSQVQTKLIKELQGQLCDYEHETQTVKELESEVNHLTYAKDKSTQDHVNVITRLQKRIEQLEAENAGLKIHRQNEGWVKLGDCLNAMYDEQLNEQSAKLDIAVEALQTLRNEVKGTLSAHELAIRYDYGNSNWNCLEMAIDKAEQAIAQIKGSKE